MSYEIIYKKVNMEILWTTIFVTISVVGICASCVAQREKPQYEVETQLIFEAVEDATKKLEERISALEAESGLRQSTPRRTPVCQEGTVSTWDAAKREFYCLAK